MSQKLAARAVDHPRRADRPASTRSTRFRVRADRVRLRDHGWMPVDDVAELRKAIRRSWGDDIIVNQTEIREEEYARHAGRAEERPACRSRSRAARRLRHAAVRHARPDVHAVPVLSRCSSA